MLFPLGNSPLNSIPAIPNSDELTVTAVIPNNAPEAGGTPILVAGTSFESDISVRFSQGGVVIANGVDIAFNTDIELGCDSPLVPIGVYDVVAEIPNFYTLSPVDIMSQDPDNLAYGAGDYTSGVWFSVGIERICTGVRIYFWEAVDIIPHTIKCCLWNITTTTLLATKNVNVGASGWFAVTFDSPVTINDTDTYSVSYHSTDGTIYWGGLVAPAAVPYIDNPNFTWLSFLKYNNGDAIPTLDTSIYTVCEPIFQPTATSGATGDGLFTST